MPVPKHKSILASIRHDTLRNGEALMFMGLDSETFEVLAVEQRRVCLNYGNGVKVWLDLDQVHLTTGKPLS